MRIFICTMEDPVYTLPFIQEIIEARRDDVVGVAVSKGNRLTISKERSKARYILALLLIMGPWHFMRHTWTTLRFKVRKGLAARTGWVASPSILAFAEARGVPTFRVRTVNDPAFLEQLRALKPDVIINQAQNILKKEVLNIPTIGVLNRHNALLPRNRGRLTPFWVAHRGESETGVSIHFVTEALDAGDIIVQERYVVSAQDDFNSLAEKNYVYAPKAMLKALDLLERGGLEVLPNDDEQATYNSTPTLREAAHYRLNRIKRLFNGKAHVDGSQRLLA